MRLLRLLCVVGSLFTVPSVEAKALVPIKVSDPALAMKVLYAKLENDDFTMSLPISARLSALMALDIREAHGEVGRLGLDYLVNGQDAKVTSATVESGDAENAPGRRIVVVHFKNFDKEMENHFFWELTKAGWVLDDVRYLDEQDGYTLSLVLKYGWDTPEEREAKDQ